MADVSRAQPSAPATARGLWPCQWPLTRFLAKSMLAILTAPYRRTFKLYTWKPLRDFRHTDGDPRAIIPLVRDWKMDKYAELQSVQVAASFCAGATLATISWTKVKDPIWVADALWFCSLICSIWAVITSIQTKSILDDIPDRDQLTERLEDSDLKRMRRVILRYKRTPGISHWVMLFIWQFPSMTMSYAWVTFLSGLTVYVCTPFITETGWTKHRKIAVVYLGIFGLGFLTYLFSSIFVYSSEKAFLQSRASTRVNTDSDNSDPETGLGISASDKHPAMQSKQRLADIMEHPGGTARDKPFPRRARQEGSQESVRSKRQLLI